MLNIADMIIELYMAESTILRVEKLKSLHPEKNHETTVLIAKSYLYQLINTCRKSGHEIIQSIPLQGIERKIFINGLNRFTKQKNYNIKEFRRKIADDLIKNKKYNYHI